MTEMKLPESMTKLQTKAVIIDKLTIEIIINLHVYFSSYIKIYQWLTTENLHFGGVAPLKLIQIGKGKKVLQFIEDAREGWIP